MEWIWINRIYLWIRATGYNSPQVQKDGLCISTLVEASNGPRRLGSENVFDQRLRRLFETEALKCTPAWKITSKDVVFGGHASATPHFRISLSKNFKGRAMSGSIT